MKKTGHELLKVFYRLLFIRVMSGRETHTLYLIKANYQRALELGRDLAIYIYKPLQKEDDKLEVMGMPIVKRKHYMMNESGIFMEV